MAKTESSMVKLGTEAPAFELTDVVSGKAMSRDDVAVGSSGLLVMFISVHCPYVQHVERQLAQIGADYSGRIGIAAICSNDVAAYPEDSPENMKQQAMRLGFSFPYFYDETQEVARAYDAACTPDFFLFDADRRLVYRGQLDGARPGNDVPVSGRDLRAALDAVLAGMPVPEPQLPSLGCSIKWKPRNEPEYVAPGHVDGAS